MMALERGKLLDTITVRADEALSEALAREQRRREAVSGVPLSRSLLVRLLLEEMLGLREPTRARE